MIELVVGIAVYLAWSVGVHTLGTVAGMILGGGLLRLRTALILAGIFGIIGLLFLSKGIVKTIGTELVSLDSTGHLSIFISMAVLITILAWRGLPVSTGYVTIGSIAGYSILNNASFNFVLFEEILVAFLTSPIASLVVAFLIYKTIEKLWLNKLKGIGEIEIFEKSFLIPGIIGFIIMATALGANSIGVVMGILGGMYSHSVLVIIGSIGFVIGLSTWSYKVAKTMGIKVTDLSPSRSFSAMLAAGLVVMAFVSFGIPVSTSQTLIGAIIGVGLARKDIGKLILEKMVVAWVVVLPASFFLAGFIGMIL